MAGAGQSAELRGPSKDRPGSRRLTQLTRNARTGRPEEVAFIDFLRTVGPTVPSHAGGALQARRSSSGNAGSLAMVAAIFAGLTLGCANSGMGDATLGTGGSVGAQGGSSGGDRN